MENVKKNRRIAELFKFAHLRANSAAVIGLIALLLPFIIIGAHLNAPAGETGEAASVPATIGLVI